MDPKSCPECSAPLKSLVDGFNRPFICCSAYCGFKQMVAKTPVVVSAADLRPLKSVCRVGGHADCLHNAEYLKKMSKNGKANFRPYAQVRDDSLPAPEVRHAI